MLENKVAIVTGGSEGIGFGIASALASKGTHVYLVARTPEKLEKAKEKIIQQGGKADIRSADITNIEAMKEIVDGVYDDNGRLDIFVNNAGEWKSMPIGTPFSSIRAMIEFNMLSPLEITDYLVNKFRNDSESSLSILNVSSQAALRVFPDGLGYGVAKMGLTGGSMHYQESLEHEGANHIKIYQLFPNTVATDKMMPAIREGNVDYPVRIDEVIDSAIGLINGKTPTRNARIGYYPGRGIVRTDLPSSPNEFYSPAGTTEEVVNSDFTPGDLLG